MARSGATPGQRFAARELPDEWLELSLRVGQLSAVWSRPEDFDTHSAPYGLNGRRALSILRREGPTRPSDLARRLETGASNVSKVLRVLEADGLIARDGDLADARRVRVELTDRGEYVADRVIADLADGLAALLEGWSHDEIVTFTLQARRLVEAADAYVSRIRPTAIKTEGAPASGA